MVSVNVAPKSYATFLLKYEELLERKLEQYELILNIHPGKVLEKLNVTVGKVKIYYYNADIATVVDKNFRM